MAGIRTLKANKTFTLQELGQFMTDHWDRREYNGFFGGKPSAGSIKPCIMLPATPRFMVLIGTGRNGKIMLSTYEMNASFARAFQEIAPKMSERFQTVQPDKKMTANKEKKGPAESVLQIYTDYLESLLKENVYI